MAWLTNDFLFSSLNACLERGMHTKGTVLLVCLRCVDTLALVSKHAEGMSLRCDVICALAYCGRHESSHIVKAHADLALWEFLGSHRFNEIQREDYLWKFVLIRVRKSSQQNICVIRGICGFKAKPQISTNFHELFVG